MVSLTGQFVFQTLYLMCRSKTFEETERVIQVEGGVTEYKSLPLGYVYPDNNVISSQYTWYSFIPKNLSEQFSNLANLYFLLVGIFQIIPAISTTDGIPTMYQPLAFIVFVSATRALSEDISKHRADNKRNSYEYDVLGGDRENGDGAEWIRVKSGDLKVGQVIRVLQNEMIPCDMLFLGSSLPQGHCFIDKANLNGETKLEVYSSIRETRYFCPPMPDTAGMSREEKNEYLAAAPATHMLDLSFELAYELPNKKFDSFRGTMIVKTEKNEFKEVKCDGHVLLMRETNLKNTDFIYGLIVYTGNDTKIQRSNLEGEKAKVKVSRIMRQVNELLKYMLITQAVLCLAGAIAAGFWAFDHGGDWYMRYTGGISTSDAVITGVLAFFTWFINLSQMVPISLIVSAEMVKFIMSRFIQMDISLYHEPIQKATRCNSSTIHEDLGLIDYVFSDKTGTLTQNKMEFRYALASDKSEYGSRITEIAKAVQQRNIELEERKNGTYKPKPAARWTELLKPYIPHRMMNPANKYDMDCCANSCCKGLWMNPKPMDDVVNSSSAYTHDNNEPSSPVALTPVDEPNCFSTSERRALLNALYGPKPENLSDRQVTERREALHQYMLHMTLSNTVKPFVENGELQFQPESAEELAMVQFAHKCGYTKLPEKEEKEKTDEEKRSNANTRISIQKYDEFLRPVGESEIHAYAFLACLGFTSARARVTVIYQEAATNKIIVMCKGQDTTVMPFLNFEDETGRFQEDLLSNLKDCCNNGLRTLVAGHAELDSTWWDKWGPEYSALKELVEADDEKKKKMEHELFENIEKDAKLGYMGCLGMEDQLQHLVPECIQACLRANVKVWMITGDKLETARNIGLACNLIDADMQPQFSAGASLGDAMSAFTDSRLIQVTGEWHSLFENKEELGGLFDAIDYNRDGIVNVEELALLLTSLHAGISQESINKSITQLVTDIPDEDSQTNPRDSARRRQRVRGLDKEAFFRVMKQFKRTPFEAVSYDVDEGIKRYRRIQDHDAFPVSLLVNRDAFLVMFPGKPASTSTSRSSVSSPKINGSRTSVTSRTDLSEDGASEQQLEELRRKFFFLASVSKSVIFARAQPAMKKKMVTEIIARVPSAVTLAIGDGANDTDMITAAHVGVGIAGVEGTAATNSADYAIGTFRMLHTLLFVHGFWSYARIANLVNFIFYKAALLAITQFLFGFYSGFSGQQFFNDPIYQLYNVMYTALPIISLAVLDKPLPKNTCEDNPAAFREQKYKAFNGHVFGSWIFRSLLHAIIVYFFPLFALENCIPSSTGHTIDLWYFSALVFYACALVPTFLVLFLMQSIQILHILAVLLSLLAIIVVSLIVSVESFFFLNPDLTGVVERQYATGTYWLILVITTLIPVLMELAYRFFCRQFFPTFTDILQEKLAIARSEEKKLNKRKFNKISSEPEIWWEPKAEVEMQTTEIAVHHLPRPMITPDEEAKWATVKGGSTKNKKDNTDVSKFLSSLDEEDGTNVTSEQKEEEMRSALIRAMLRFRNSTGSQFESAASSKYQKHDKFVSSTQGAVGGRNLIDGTSVDRIPTIKKQKTAVVRRTSVPRSRHSPRSSPKVSPRSDNVPSLALDSSATIYTTGHASMNEYNAMRPNTPSHNRSGDEDESPIKPRNIPNSSFSPDTRRK